ncbi:MAG: NifB/NifX family molybdenum-iron cluster-binding protein [Syntrophomonas sp.]|nr:NifB/NifX family molybdenum-iron cluster-binding protein [Syntrophomonas sp.]
MVGTKIAVCARGESPAALVDGHFGRCAYFMLWDDGQGRFEAISNSGPELNQGAGTGAVQELLRRGVGILICNRIGPKAITVFQRAGVKIYGAGEGLDTETALKQYKAGELPSIEAANNI